MTTQPFHILFCSNQQSTVSKTMDYLKEKKYSVLYTDSEKALIHILKNNNIQLVIVELDFKQKDGIAITNEIRNSKQLEQPYIMIFTNKADDYIQITVFNAGADDFIITPIKPNLLEPRIAQLKKRYVAKQTTHENFSNTQKFYVDEEQYAIIINQKKITLPRKEFQMIQLMYHQFDKVFTRQDFAKIIWNSPDVAKSRTIDIHIRNIRRVLGNDIIKTTKGVGYTINKELL